MITSLTPVSYSHERFLLPAARDLTELVSNPDNDDLTLDFGYEHDIFSRSVDTAYAELGREAALYEPGEYEQFLIHVQDESNGRASPQVLQTVGLASLCLTLPRYVPPRVDPDTPNLSLFICRPFRGRGIGPVVVRQLLDIVHTNFHGETWTLVRQANTPSQKVIIGAGFTQVGESIKPHCQTPVNFYTYRNRSAG